MIISASVLGISNFHNQTLQLLTYMEKEGQSVLLKHLVVLVPYTVLPDSVMMNPHTLPGTHQGKRNSNCECKVPAA